MKALREHEDRQRTKSAWAFAEQLMAESREKQRQRNALAGQVGEVEVHLGAGWLVRQHGNGQ